MRRALARPSPTGEHQPVHRAIYDLKTPTNLLSRSRPLGNAGAARRHVPRRDFSGPHCWSAGATHAGWAAAAHRPSGVANCLRRPSWFRALANRNPSTGQFPRPAVRAFLAGGGGARYRGRRRKGTGAQNQLGRQGGGGDRRQPSRSPKPQAR